VGARHARTRKLASTAALTTGIQCMLPQEESIIELIL
jgi:hypothetical protein